MDWFTLTAVFLALQVPLFGLFLLLPDSPRWLAARGRSQQAQAALQWLSGSKAVAEQELGEMQSGQQQEAGQQKKVEREDKRGLYLTMTHPATWLSLALLLAIHLCGSGPMIFFSVK